MLIDLSHVAELSTRIGHHALLLTNKCFAKPANDEGEGGLPFEWFAQLAKHFCGIEFNVTGDTEALWMQTGRHSDVFIADRTRAILRLEDVASISQLAMYPPQRARRRLFFIDSCGRLNQHATNSLLKLLEEPLIPCLFLLTAGRESEVLPTIVSRCFRLQAKIDDYQTQALPLEESDWLAICEHLSTLVQSAPVSQGNTIWSSQATSSKVTGKAGKIQAIVTLTERLGKQYEASALQGALTRFVADRWAQDGLSHSLARAQMRFILSDLREWQQSKAYHPSSAHWLARILLKSVV